MSKTRMKDPIRNEGEITTLDELDKRGMIEFRKVEHFYNRKGAVYFADVKGTTDGWEIGEVAYQSRTRAKANMAMPLPAALKPPAGSGLQLQSSFGGGGGQTHFKEGSPKKKGKTAAKKNPKKHEKKGSGSLAAFGVMPAGQKTLEEIFS